MTAAAQLAPAKQVQSSLLGGMLRWIGRHERWTVPLILLVLCAIAYPDVFFRGQVIAPADLIYWYAPWNQQVPEGITPGSNPILSDQMDMFIPQVKYVRECLLRGDVPAWCDKIQNGTPFYWVVKHEMMVFPMLVLVLIFDVPWGMTIYFILRHLVGGLFCYKCTRILGIGRWASLCGAIVFSYCKYSVQDFIFPMYLQLILVPVIAYATERIIRDRSLLWCTLLPFAVWMNILAGFPAGSVYCLYLLVAYTAFRVLFQSGRRLRLAATFAGLYLVAALMALPALVATADFFSGFDWSYRAGHWGWRLPDASLMTWFFPFFFGSPYDRLKPLGSWYEYSLYCGVLPLLILVMSLLWGRPSAVRGFYLVFAAWLLALLYDLGGILERFVRHLPVLGSNPNTRQKMLLAFVMAVLVAFALDLFVKQANRRRLARLTNLLLLPIGALVGWGCWAYSANRETTEFVQSHLLIQGAVIAMSVAALIAISLRQFLGPWLRIAVLAVVFLDLQLMDKTCYPLARREREGKRSLPEKAPRDDRLLVGWNPTIDPEAFYPSTPGIDWLISHIGPCKMLGLDSAFLANTPLFFDINNINGRGFFDRRTKELYQLINEDAFGKGQNTQSLFCMDLRTRLGSQLVDALGVRFVVLPPGTTLDELNRDYLVRQREWNSSVKLTAGQQVRQTFVAERTLRPDRLSVKTNNELRDLRALRLAIEHFDSGQAWQCDDMEWNPVTGTLDFHLSECEFTAGEDYALDVFVDRGAEGAIEFLCAKDVDLIRSGRLHLNGEPQNADLTFSIYLDVGPQYVVRQPEWNDHVDLHPGETLVQTVRSARALRVDRCEVRVRDNLLEQPDAVQLTIREAGSAAPVASVTGRWRPDAGYFAFDLTGFEFEARRDYGVELSVSPENSGLLRVFCTKDVDLIPTGQLSANGIARSGDLTFSIYASAAHDLGKFKLAYDEDLVVLENTAALGRAFLVGGIRYANDEETLLGLRNGAEDLRKCAWVNLGDRAVVGDPLPPRTVAGEVAAVHLRSCFQQFQVNAERDCYLIVSDNHDPQWRAFIDGHQTPIFRADYNLRGIRLPAGDHVVEFHYSPPYFLASMGMAITSSLAFLALILHTAARRLRRQPTGAPSASP